VDEVQTGIGTTGTMWAVEQMGVAPDIIAFGKKAQVCGIIAGRRLDEAPENVFHVPSRINSTWGGNLVDMVRSQRYLEIIEEDHLVDNAGRMGQHLLDGMTQIALRSDLISNVRGRGMFLAFDLPDPRARDLFRGLLWENGLIALKSGTRSIRFRPMLDLCSEAVDEALAIVEDTLYDARADGGQL
jgi:L-lysine 6-transaminase